MASIFGSCLCRDTPENCTCRNVRSCEAGIRFAMATLTNQSKTTIHRNSHSSFVVSFLLSIHLSFQDFEFLDNRARMLASLLLQCPCCGQQVVLVGGGEGFFGLMGRYLFVFTKAKYSGHSLVLPHLFAATTAKMFRPALRKRVFVGSPPINPRKFFATHRILESAPSPTHKHGIYACTVSINYV